MRHEELLRLMKTSHVPFCFDVAQQRRQHSSQAWFEQMSVLCAGKLMDPIVWHADSTDDLRFGGSVIILYVTTSLSVVLFLHLLCFDSHFLDAVSLA
jgi:hypothetical protein